MRLTRIIISAAGATVLLLTLLMGAIALVPDSTFCPVPMLLLTFPGLYAIELLLGGTPNVHGAFLFLGAVGSALIYFIVFLLIFLSIDRIRGRRGV